MISPEDPMPFAPYFGFIAKEELRKPYEQSKSTPVPADYPKRLKADAEEAIGIAVVRAFIETCKDTICGCPTCRMHSKLLQEYFKELPKTFDRFEARDFLKQIEGKIINFKPDKEAA